MMKRCHSIRELGIERKILYRGCINSIVLYVCLKNDDDKLSCSVGNSLNRRCSFHPFFYTSTRDINEIWEPHKPLRYEFRQVQMSHQVHEWQEFDTNPVFAVEELARVVPNNNVLLTWPLMTISNWSNKKSHPALAQSNVLSKKFWEIELQYLSKRVKRQVGGEIRSCCW